MKKLFQKAGVPVVPGAVIKTDEDVDKAVKEIGLPMIAKPDNGVGAAATFKLETEDAVSYTHLDVYKRQNECFTFNSFTTWGIQCGC